MGSDERSEDDVARPGDAPDGDGRDRPADERSDPGRDGANDADGADDVDGAATDGTGAGVGDAATERPGDGAAVAAPADQWHDEPPAGWSEDDDGDTFGAGSEGEDEPLPVEPGDLTLENALFVLLGALTALGLLLYVVLTL